MAKPQDHADGMSTVLDLPALKAKLFRARLSLVEEEPFLGSLTLSLPVFIEAREGLTTACVTSEGDCYFCPEFLSKLTLPAVRAVLLHEVLHLALDAFPRRELRHPRLWNMAHDFAINQMIEDIGLPASFLRWPKDFPPLLDAAYKGLNAEQIYDRILAALPQAPPGWKGDIVQVPGSGTRAGTTPEALREKWRDALVAAAEKAMRAKEFGSLPGWAQKLLGPILKPQITWQERLAQRIHGRVAGRTRTFSRPGRRSAAVGAILPGPRRNLGVLGVFVDVSGSVSPDELTAFMAELRGILDQVPILVRFISWDAEVHEELLLDPGEDLQALIGSRKLKLVGGGGTDPRCVIRHLQDDNSELPMPSYGVLLTDGALDWPDARDWPLDLLVVTSAMLPPDGYDAITLSLPNPTEP